ncbi:hypothetical protein PMAYCL1PPCAC_23927 [Pristionchus mayeri]|uniref:Uncharacterized protein n=1 Tax=Pristionchus mayeri TaxID=1317129 RepID=A0AAN5D080_9BILA|nr:hypothetical protein PMAYCL1PPCAC_23927 [Pristionchus mayeri]
MPFMEGTRRKDDLMSFHESTVLTSAPFMGENRGNVPYNTAFDSAPTNWPHMAVARGMGDQLFSASTAAMGGRPRASIQLTRENEEIFGDSPSSSSVPSDLKNRMITCNGIQQRREDYPTAYDWNAMTQFEEKQTAVTDLMHRMTPARKILDAPSRPGFMNQFGDTHVDHHHPNVNYRRNRVMPQREYQRSETSIREDENRNADIRQREEIERQFQKIMTESTPKSDQLQMSEDPTQSMQSTPSPIAPATPTAATTALNALSLQQSSPMETESENQKMRDLSAEMMKRMDEMGRSFQEQMDSQRLQYLTEQSRLMERLKEAEGRSVQPTGSSSVSHSEQNQSEGEGSTVTNTKSIGMSHPLHLDFVCPSCKPPFNTTVRQKIMAARLKLSKKSANGFDTLVQRTQVGLVPYTEEEKKDWIPQTVLASNCGLDPSPHGHQVRG